MNELAKQIFDEANATNEVYRKQLLDAKKTPTEKALDEWIWEQYRIADEQGKNTGD